MKTHINDSTAMYRHVILEGRSYDVGKKLGEHLKVENDYIREFYLETQTVKSVQRINHTNAKQYLCATNHYTSRDMLKYDNARYWDSVTRYIAMELCINEAIPNVDKSKIKNIQSDLIPLGTCSHNYESRFGTLWLAIYDVTDINIEACFGSPKVNTGIHLI